MKIVVYMHRTNREYKVYHLSILSFNSLAKSECSFFDLSEFNSNV